MRKFLALAAVLTSTALVSPMALAKGGSPSKARATHAVRAPNRKPKTKAPVVPEAVQARQKRLVKNK